MGRPRQIGERSDYVVKAVRRAMVAADVHTERQLSRVTGIPPATVNMIFNLKSVIDVEQLKKIASGLHTTDGALLDDADRLQTDSPEDKN